MNFNEKIKKLRIEKGLTQEGLAEQLCVTRSAVAKWESGASYPNIDVIKDVSVFFGTSIDSLLSGDEILTVVNTEKTKVRKKMLNVIFAVLDAVSVLLVFLPLFANKIDSTYYSVPLFSSNTITDAVKIITVILLSAMTIVGITETLIVILQDGTGVKPIGLVSLSLHGFGILVFAVSRQPYVSAIVFLFFLIKVIVAIKPNVKAGTKAEN